MKKVISLLLTIGFVFGISACAINKKQTLENQLLGEWVGSQSTNYRIPSEITFMENHAVKGDSQTGTFSVEGNILRIQYVAQEPFTYEIRIESDKFYLKSSDISDDTEYLFTKKEEEKQTNEKAEQKLSDSCEYQLAEGEDYDGSYYELVMNINEKASGDSYEIGVIKDNKWFRKPSEKHPIANETKYLLDSMQDSRFSYEFDDFSFIGNACFAYIFHSTSAFLVYNCENNKICHMGNENEYLGECLNEYQEWKKMNSMPENGFDENILLYYNYHYGSTSYYDIYYLNRKTMERKLIKERVEEKPIIPLSKGIYGVKVNNTDDNSQKIIFYNLNNQRVFQTDSYYRIYDNNEEAVRCFKNDVLEFVAVNNNNKKFKITINREGKVISEEALG